MPRFKKGFIDDYAIGLRLAEIGASKRLIVKTTSIGSVYATNMVRKYGNESKASPRYVDVVSRIHSSAESLANAGKIIKIYQYIDHSKSRNERLISTYESYMICETGPLITPDEVLDIMDLYESDGFVVKTCESCRTKFHVVLDVSKCPACNAISEHSCEACHQPFIRTSQKGRKRRFCSRPECISMRGKVRKRVTA